MTDMTRDELVALLMKGGVDISLYGKDGWRSIEDALTEVNTGDIRPTFNEYQGCVDFYRHRVKGICHAEGYILLEKARWYPKKERIGAFKIWFIDWPGFKDWKRIYELQEFSISETMRLGKETPIKALIRGVREEWGLHIGKERCKREFLLDSNNGRRKSRVYPGVWSIGREEWISFYFLKRFCRYDPIAKDEGVLIFLEWFPISRERWYLKWERKIYGFFVRTYVMIRSLF